MMSLPTTDLLSRLVGLLFAFLVSAKRPEGVQLTPIIGLIKPR